MMEVSLHDILEAREARARQQQALLAEHRVPLLCFTMNIAGPVKTTPLIQRGFYAGLGLLDSKLPQENILFREAQVLPTGCEAIYAIDLPAGELKRLCTDIEEKHPLGRLFDMDVIGTDGAKLERETQRGCIVCGAPGRLCAASRAHCVEQLQAVTTERLTQYFRCRDPERVAALAVQSLLQEVYTTPKPGLVDRRNNGSHKDMDLSLFETSAQALRPFFQRCVEIGQETSALAPEETFPLLRDAGVKAEEAMFQATGGVNTHKGAIYALGLLCGSIGRLWAAENPIADVDILLAESGNIVRSSVQADLASATGKTAGERLYLQYGIRGIRGEAADGFPTVRNIGLPHFRRALADGLSPNDAGAITLLHFVTQAEDTNLYHRGGPEGARWAACTAKKLLSDHPPYPRTELIAGLDDAFMERNLSPGGCADLLAVTCFLHSLTL
jgi:holo-ACP synthase/triphosphoribosyl-dephospho-CoA synthase